MRGKNVNCHKSMVFPHNAPSINPELNHDGYFWHDRTMQIISNINNINIRDMVRYGGIDMGVKIDCLSPP